MIDLPARLRRYAGHGGDLPLGVPGALVEAADRIERLEAELARCLERPVPPNWDLP